MKSELTICIPTYNRGERALKNVQYLLENLEENYSILVLDNASTNQTQFYKKIEEISKTKSCVTYIKHKTNLQFYGNYLSCFKYAKSDYIIIISDEDFANLEELKSVLEQIKEDKNLGAYRGSIQPHKDLTNSANSIIYSDTSFSVGEESIKSFPFTNNYITGMIYNLNLIKKYNLLDILEKNITKHKNYPHIYFAMLIGAKCNTKLSSKVVAFEGASELKNTKDEQGNQTYGFDHIGLYGFGERVNQFFSLRDGILDAVLLLDVKSENDKFLIFINIYANLVEKYFYLIAKCNMSAYKQNYLEESLLKEAFYYICASGIFAYPQIEPYKNEVANLLSAIYQQYK